MKIILIGEFLKSRLELSYKASFESLGCRVFSFHTGIIPYIFKPLWQYTISRKLLRNLNLIKPDLVMVMKGYFLSAQTIIKIKKLTNALIFCFNSDDPFNISHIGSSNKDIIECIPYYDCYFTFSNILVEKIKAKGAKRVEYLPFGFDHHLHFPVKVSLKEKKIYGNDVVFVGNWSEEREDYLKELLEFDLGIWGENYWKKFCKNKELKKKWRKKAAYGIEQAKILNSSKISLNILRAQNKGSHNMRTFELPACGAFVISERSPEIEEFFKEDKELVLFSSSEELKEKIRYYLKNEEKRNEIAYNGFRRCIESEYTYQARAKRILEVFDCLKDIKLL
ncbi:MAG: glycosyltransferase [Candidatus Omnitrophica bacterium]|nr:glycosyltransferase [Candidatus Omnitrophota bacterium]